MDIQLENLFLTNITLSMILQTNICQEFNEFTELLGKIGKTRLVIVSPTENFVDNKVHVNQSEKETNFVKEKI